MNTRSESPPSASGLDALDDYRLTQPSEIVAMLKRLVDGAVPLNLNAPDGTAVHAMLSTLDSARRRLSFTADAREARLRTLIECDESTVVGYLDNIKLQFDVTGLMLVHGSQGSALTCAFPSEMFRFQRRNGFRVQPLLCSVPVVTMRHPMIPDMKLELRLLDVSISGCALFLPNTVPPLDPGVLLNGVQMDLDADTQVHCSLRLQHVTSIHPDSQGVRLGFEMVNTGRGELRALQQYIDQTQKRRRLMARE